MSNPTLSYSEKTDACPGSILAPRGDVTSLGVGEACPGERTVTAKSTFAINGTEAGFVERWRPKFYRYRGVAMTTNCANPLRVRFRWQGRAHFSTCIENAARMIDYLYAQNF